MKLQTLAILSLATLMTACAQTQQAQVQPQPQPQYTRQYVQQSAHPYAMTQEVAKPVNPAPGWFTRTPADTPDMLFSAGTATSMDEQMAYDKARLQAERKLVEMMTARVRSNTKSHRTDNGDSMAETTSVTINKTSDGELIGAQRVDSQASFDGKRYKVYVLLRYPLAENNPLRKEREAKQLKRENDLRAARAQQDLEIESDRANDERIRADERLRKEIGPRELPVKATAPADVPPAVKGPGSVQTDNGEIQLMQVDNVEYKQRRDSALQKEGAVIGNSVMR